MPAGRIDNGLHGPVGLGIAFLNGHNLGLDVEVHRVGGLLVHHGEQLVQSVDGGTGHPVEGVLVLFLELIAADGAELLECQLGDELSHIGVGGIIREGRGGIPALLFLNGHVVPNHRIAVLGERNIQLQGSDAQGEGVFVGSERTFGGLRLATTVSLQIEPLGEVTCRVGGSHRGCHRCRNHGSCAEDGKECFLHAVTRFHLEVSPRSSP